VLTAAAAESEDGRPVLTEEAKAVAVASVLVC
jgi:hypothetical protein